MPLSLAVAKDVRFWRVRVRVRACVYAPSTDPTVSLPCSSDGVWKHVDLPIDRHQPTSPQGPGQVPSSRSGEILDLSKDTFHHPAVRAPWCELTLPRSSLGSIDLGLGRK